MNPYSIPNFIVGLYILGLGAFVLISNPKSNKNVFFFLLSLSSSGWLLSYGLAYSTEDYKTAFLLLKIGHVSAILVSPIVYTFMLAVLGPYRKRFDILLGKFTIFYGIVSAVLVFIYPPYLPGIVKYWWGYYLVGGPLMVIYALWTFFIATRCIYLLSSASKIAKCDLKNDDYQRFKYYALSISIFVPASADYISKFTFIPIAVYPFGYIFVAAFASLTTYAILRHKLLDVDVVIRRGVLYSVLISMITFIYLMVILLSEQVFQSYFGYRSLVVALIVSSVVALSFNSIRNYLQRIIDSYFFKIDPEKIIEENIRLKDAVQKQDQMKAVATLAAGMAHEIKNPLTSIKTFAEYLPQRYDDPEFREKFTRIVIDEVDRVNNIVGQLLEFSKPKELELKSETITPILEDTLNLLNNNFLKSKIEVVRDYKANPILLVDKNQLKQAFLNLFLNAIQAMPNGGTLTVGTSLLSLPVRQAGTDSCLLITISDTGHGIPKDQLPHIFDPFFTTKEEGTGLGLSIVHGIITKHRGKIEAESNINKGSMFKIFLGKT